MNGERLYAYDKIDTGHLVAAQDDCSRNITTHCGHPIFTPSKPPVPHHPDVDSFCAGCKDYEDKHPIFTASGLKRPDSFTCDPNPKDENSHEAKL
jgi:hypothetical protein